ncbi:NUDIX domain-containing protein [Nocardioides sp.]|uniref:NUDIX domain-containing protein n=1 Tax=Nocardioides sp. TaxID=35761 RepID=UPI003D107728
MTASAPISDLPDESWPVTESVDLHRDGWVIALRSDRIRPPGHHDGPDFRRFVVEHPGAVVILAMDDDRQVVCLRQYRHAVRHRLLELPAGLRDEDGEPAVETAKRELREEAEVEAEHWTRLLSTWSSPGFTTERIEIFLATGLRDSPRGDFVLEHEEAEMERLMVPFDDLLAAVLDGRVADGPVVQAVLAVKVRGLDRP